MSNMLNWVREEFLQILPVWKEGTLHTALRVTVEGADLADSCPLCRVHPMTERTLRNAPTERRGVEALRQLVELVHKRASDLCGFPGNTAEESADCSWTAKSGRALAQYMSQGQTAQLTAAQHAATEQEAYDLTFVAAAFLFHFVSFFALVTFGSFAEQVSQDQAA